ncbi:hypothetical protein BC831DRAFT_511651 [Entophlyctis helioformis]|nr:hypothetical protein BC831DRAFT_511651 [Entophlyctis helioformis]
MDDTEVQALMARLMPAHSGDAVDAADAVDTADAVDAWTTLLELLPHLAACLPQRHSALNIYMTADPVVARTTLLWNGGMQPAILFALSHPSSAIKILALQAFGAIVKYAGFTSISRAFDGHNIGGTIMGLLFDTDTTVRSAAATLLQTVATERRAWARQVVDNSAIYAAALTAQTERSVILDLLAVFGKGEIATYLFKEHQFKPLIETFLNMLEWDDEVAASASMCLSKIYCYSNRKLFEEMDVMLSVLRRFKKCKDAWLDSRFAQVLKNLMTDFSGGNEAKQAMDAGILDLLDSALERALPTIDRQQSLVTSASRIILTFMYTFTDEQLDTVANAPVTVKLVALIGHPNRDIADEALRQLYSSIQYSFKPAILAPYLRHGLVPALFKHLQNTTVAKSSLAVSALHTISMHYADKPENPVAVEMEALEFFEHHVTTADTSILPNESNIDLPVPLIPEMEQKFLTVKEREYLGLRAAILNKPLWWTKFTDPVIAAKWRDEAVEQGVAQRALSLLFSELAYLAEHEMRTVKLASGDACTTMSDDAVPESLRDALIRQVAVLEDVPDHKKDWHPGSDGMVLDLVHPSLYPLVYGRSLVLSRSDRVKATSTPPSDVVSASERVSGLPVFGKAAAFVSMRFQWLPSEFRVHDDGTVSINSYINNLHPIWNNSLYKTIAKVFERFVPLFESLFGYSDGFASYIDGESITDLYATRLVRRKFRAKVPVLPSDDDDEAYESAVAVIDKIHEDEENDVQDDDEEELDDDDERYDDGPSLRGRNLQVIVKLANIHLTPENPEYGGGSWHVEGAANESIVATGIYYYDMDNTTESRLSFRTTVDTEDQFNTDQDEYAYYEEVYGFENQQSGGGVQQIGFLQATQGRCIAFPNSWQHHVEPFQLADRTRPGHRKILAFFLVDPRKAVVSTAHVAPQQPEWHEMGVMASRLPPELARFIGPHVDGVMGWQEALDVRVALMAERSAIDRKREDAIASFSLCEH